MPSGRVHFKIEAGLLLPLGAGGIVLMREGWLSGKELAVFLLGYVFSSLFLSPDLDLWGSRATRRWGLGRVLWYPYSKLFRHRSISHNLLLGPLTRIAYLGGLIVLGLWCWDALRGGEIKFFKLSPHLLGTALLGLYLPNQVHILVDRAWSMIKGWRRG